MEYVSHTATQGKHLADHLICLKTYLLICYCDDMLPLIPTERGDVYLDNSTMQQSKISNCLQDLVAI